MRTMLVRLVLAACAAGLGGCSGEDDGPDEADWLVRRGREGDAPGLEQAWFTGHGPGPGASSPLLRPGGELLTPCGTRT